MEFECVICNEVHAVHLTCNHNVCLPCILKLYDGVETTSCPVCKQIIEMTPILKLTSCARCKSLQNNYCAKCSNFLCDPCWMLIHSFPPANTHLKSVFTVDVDQRKQLFDQIEMSNKNLKLLDADLVNLNEESLKVVSVKRRTLDEVRMVFDGYRKQLYEQQEVIEAYINEQTLLKKEQLLMDKVAMKTHNELCSEKILEFDPEVSIPEAPVYCNRLEYNLCINSVILPEIVSIPDEVMVRDEHGVERWFSKGVLHRSHDLPAVIYPHGRREWYRRGLRHRDGDEPAWIESDGYKAWYKDGLQHRDNDKPALIQSSGCEQWLQYGRLHRINGPALIHPNREQRWCRNGDYYRENDEPAYIDKDKQMWYANGKLHRETGPAIAYTNGDQMWFLKGQLHRSDGPARIYANGRQEYYINGLLHRSDGPAIIFPGRTEEYYIDGVLHRDNDEPAVIRPRNTQKWYHKGVLSRDNDQPAVISDKKRVWYLCGRIHRDDKKPAIIYKDGKMAFYANGKQYFP